MLTIAIDQQQRRSAVKLELLPVKAEGAQAQWRTGK
jgi:hypothetical protein